MDRDTITQERKKFWARKEQDRLDGERWIMRHGTTTEKLQLMNRVAA